MENTSKIISIIGGTGKEGKGLAFRWAKAGFEIIIGSRLEEKAQSAAGEINQLLAENKFKVVGKDNIAAAKLGEIIVLTVPFSVHREMLASIKEAVQGKLFIDVTVPVVPPKVTKVQMPPAGSAALEAKEILGEDVKIVTAFQNISYERLMDDGDIDCDILVCGEKESRQMVIGLIREMGLTAWDAGPIENSMVVEGMTSILIGLNKQFGIQNAGIKITGIPKKS